MKTSKILTLMVLGMTYVEAGFNITHGGELVILATIIATAITKYSGD